MSKVLDCLEYVRSELELSEYCLTTYDRVMLKQVEKELKTLEILKKYIYYSEKSHCIRMREIRKSTHNFDYEDLKEVLEK